MIWTKFEPNLLTTCGYCGKVRYNELRSREMRMNRLEKTVGRTEARLAKMDFGQRAAWELRQEKIRIKEDMARMEDEFPLGEFEDEYLARQGDLSKVC
jgi:hypothetical protein